MQSYNCFIKSHGGSLWQKIQLVIKIWNMDHWLQLKRFLDVIRRSPTMKNWSTKKVYIKESLDHFHPSFIF